MSVTEQLTQIEKTSNIARTNWIGLIALMVFLSVTLMRHEDVAFFAADAATQLPLVGLSIPVPSFFYAAPVLLSAAYIYLHLYLSTLWPLLSRTPPIIHNETDTVFAHRVYPWLLTHAFLWERQRVRQDGCTLPTPFGGLMALLTLLVTWIPGPLILAWMWVLSWPNHDAWMSSCIGWLFGLSCCIGGWSFYAARHYAREAEEDLGLPKRVSVWALVILFLLILRPISVGTTIGWSSQSYKIALPGHVDPYDWEGFEKIFRTREGTPDPEKEPQKYWAELSESWEQHHRTRSSFTITASANLTEERLEDLPKNWQPYDDWLDAAKSTYLQKQPVNGWSNLSTKALSTFWEERRTAWDKVLFPLRRLDLRNRNLSGARLTKIIAIKADLRGAQLQGADLRDAQLQGADLSVARLQGANLRGAQLQGANLIGAQLQGANLIGAQLQGVDLIGAQLQGADLSVAQLQGADLSVAQLQGADLIGAQLQGADLSVAQLQGADLSVAQLQGADLSVAQLQGAYLWSAQLQGANVFKAQIYQKQLSSSSGDSETHLQRGQWVVSCNIPMSHFEGYFGTNNCQKNQSPEKTGRWVADCSQMSTDPTIFKEEDTCYTLVKDNLDKLLPADDETLSRP